MLKYLSKFTLDVLPSLLATVIGAYIVNHYIVAKPDAPVAAVASTAEPKADAEAAKAEAKGGAKTPETSADVANIPEPGVRAKGISEKSVLDKATATVEKPADKPAETASIPADTRRHPAAPREKTVAKTVPAPQPAAPTVVPVVVPSVAAAPNPVPPADAVTAATPVEEHRDANDLARAAIERLRGMTDTSPHPQEAARAPEAPRAPEAARLPDAPHVVYAAPVEAPRLVPTPAVRPLPPPIMVSTPAGEAVDPAAPSSQGKPPYDAARNDDPRRLTPPADIPVSQPLDLRAEAMEPLPREHRNVAEDMLSAAKSVFHAVLPK